MSSLRRDLFERHRWPVVVVLILAIVAIPVVLHGHATASAESQVPAVPRAAKAEAGGIVHKTVHSRAPRSDPHRNPFESPLKSHHGTTSMSAPATSTPVRTTPAAPSPAATTTPVVTTTPAATKTPSSASGGPAVSQRARTTTRAEKTTAASTKAVTPVRSWTIYSVDVSIGAAGHSSVRGDIPRLTPLPSAASPKVMYAGVATGGHDAIFELAVGVHARGPGLCRPDHARCSAIVLPVHGVEQLTFTDTADKIDTLALKVTRIDSRITHSKTEAVAAISRQSADGACEVELGDPVSYQADKGALTATAGVSTLCRQARRLVPFPGVTSGS